MHDLLRTMEKLEIGKNYFVKGKERYTPPGFGQVECEKDYKNYGKLEKKDGDHFYFDNFVLDLDRKPVTKVILSSYITINMIVECDAESAW